MALIHAYFDESGSDQEDRFFCVAGYIFEKNPCLQLDWEWRALLDGFGLEFFRMSDCAHGNGPFAKLTKQERDRAARTAIGSITRHAKVGVCTAISEALVLRLEKDPVDPLASAYSLLCYLSLLGVKQWADEADFSGRIAYFFEAGHRFQAQANALMQDVFRLPEEREAFRYASHTFVDKRLCRPVQTADILAWHMATDRKRQSGGKGKRADFVELLKCPTIARVIDEEQLSEFRSWWINRPASEKALFEWGRRTLGRSRREGG